MTGKPCKESDCGRRTQGIECGIGLVAYTITHHTRQSVIGLRMYGGSQEMVAFVTELNTNYYSVRFLKGNDCDRYYRYNKGLLFDERHEEILGELDEVEGELNRVLK